MSMVRRHLKRSWQDKGIWRFILIRYRRICRKQVSPDRFVIEDI